MDSVNPASGYWLGRAHRLAFYVNFVWVIERIIPVVIIANLTASCGILILRRQLDWVEPVFYALLGIVALAAIILALVRRKNPFKVDDALLRLETALHLDNRLTMAQTANGTWPHPMPGEMSEASLYDLRWQRPLVAVMVSFSMLLAALWIPIGAAQPKSPLAEDPSLPLSIGEVEVWIDQLEKADFIEDNALQDLKEAVADLKNRPSDEWFTSGALEAADHLRENTESAIEGLARNMQMVSALLSGAPGLPESLNAQTYELLEEAYRAALSEMQAGTLPISPELMQQFEQMNFSNLASIDPDQLKDLQNRSEQWANACQQMGGMTEAEKQQLADYYESLCEGGEGNARRTMPGSIQRGRGDAEMSYSQYRSPDEVGVSEAVSNDDLRNAAINDTIRTTISNQQESPPEFTGPVEAGRMQSSGAGGEAVWVDRLTPSERKLLRNHFK